MADPQSPRRAAVIDLLASQKRALHASEIADRLSIPTRMVPALSRVLDDLVFDGTVVPQAGQRFKLAGRERERSRSETLEGIFSANPRGFGFVNRGRGEEDVYIPPEAVGGAMHGDKVSARVVTRSNRGIEGAIVDIIERRPLRIAGALRRRGSGVWLEPDDARVRGPIVLTGVPEGAKDGEVAIVDIQRFPETSDENPEGRVVEILGEPGTPDVEVKKILAVAGIVEAHPLVADEEARSFGEEVDPAALEGREDLTHLPLPTIDPQDARDHDDAIWAERREGGGYRIWIAIADVSHYVAEGTGLDEAARERGCSIYLPDRAIPMLPRALSSNLCSLLPDVTRLCLCAIVDLDAAGVVAGSRIVEGFMRSRAKLTYEGVARALRLTTEAERDPAAEALREELGVLREAAMLLRGRRMRRGALDFDLPETRIVVDQATRYPIDAVRRAKDPGVQKAYQIVEEMMLLANEVVAEFIVENDVPGIFRVHAKPDLEKIERFAAICKKLGVEIEVEDAQDPKKLSAFVKKIKAHPARALLDTLLVRSLKQAMYDVTNIGHFGLASDAYVHFTSPIRRYPDLAVHRVVRALLRRRDVDRSEEGLETMRTAAVTASERERRAMQVERDVADLYGVFLMREALGDMFTGSVSAIVSSGVFVNLEDPYVSVLVKSEALGGDSYEADDEGFSLTGHHTKERITLGDGMMVQIEDTSIERRTVYARRVSVPSERDVGAPPKKRKGNVAEPEPPGRSARKVRRSGSSGPASDARKTPSSKRKSASKPKAAASPGRGRSSRLDSDAPPRARKPKANAKAGKKKGRK